MAFAVKVTVHISITNSDGLRNKLAMVENYTYSQFLTCLSNTRFVSWLLDFPMFLSISATT